MVQMPLSPTIAKAIGAAFITPEELSRTEKLQFLDSGHGYDTFGMHPSFIALGQALTSPLYDKYFRVQSSGHHHIPESGPVVIAANHSGKIPLDAMMLWLDLVRKTEPPRVPRPVADHFVPALPWVGTLFARGGMVGGSRGNARTLLVNGEMMMVFPEGVPGILKPESEAYKLQTFRQGHAELAIRHRAPVVPVGIIGPEDQFPEIASSRRLGKLFGLPRLPIPASIVPLPVRYHLLYGPQIPLHLDYTKDQADDPAIVAEAALRVQTAVQELIDKGLEDRVGVFE